MKTAIYPGTFDPITYGHIDVIKKSLNIFDKLIVATTNNINKNYHFSIEDRLNIINCSLFKDLKLSKKKIKVIPFDTTEELRDTIKWYRPNIMVIGSDWKGKEVIGDMFADKLVFFDRVGEYSTTRLSRYVNH